MDEAQVRQIVTEVLQEFMAKSQYSTGAIPVHHHTGRGNDAPTLPFLGLSDTPVSYYGNAGKVATVNATENALEFDAVAGGSLEVRESDGAPDVTGVTKIYVPNGSLVDYGGGSILLKYSPYLTVVEQDGSPSYSTGLYTTIKVPNGTLSSPGAGIMALNYSGPITVKDGVTIVTPVTTVNFTSGATVTNAGSGEADVAISGGGGGSPGGSDRDVQFNNAAAFGGDDNFKYLATNPLDAGGELALNNGFLSGGPAEGNLYVGTNNTTLDSDISGSLNIFTGDSSGNGAYSADVTLKAGTVSGTTSTAGVVRISGGAATDASGRDGSVDIRGSYNDTNSADVRVSGSKSNDRGAIVLNPGVDSSSRPSAVQVGGLVDIGGSLIPSDYAGSGASGPVVFIQNANTYGSVPTSPVTGYGIFYVQSGALKYMGSSGTVTTIAPA